MPSINWYHRGERRYVDYGSSGAAVRTFGVLRTITDTVYNMNFDHLSRAQPTVFERLDDAGVRTACTPFLIFRGRTRHELARAGMDAARGPGGELPARGLRAGRAVLRRALLLAGGRLPRRRSRARARATPTRAASARTSSARPLRLHALLAARQRSLLAPPRTGRDGHLDRARRPAPAASSSSRRAASSAFSRRPRRDPDGRPRADRGRRAASGSPRRSRRLAGAAAERPRPRRPPSSPSAPARARRWSTCSATRSARAARLRDGAARGCETLEGVERARLAGGRRGVRVDRAAASCASRPGRGLTRPPRRALGRRRARSRRSSSSSADGVLGQPRLPGCAAAGSGRRSTAPARATSSSRPRAATSSSTGAAPITSAAAATARCAAATRSARSRS